MFQNTVTDFKVTRLESQGARRAYQKALPDFCPLRTPKKQIYKPQNPVQIDF